MSLAEWFTYQWRRERRDIEKTDIRITIPWPVKKDRREQEKKR